MKNVTVILSLLCCDAIEIIFILSQPYYSVDTRTVLGLLEQVKGSLKFNKNNKVEPKLVFQMFSHLSPLSAAVIKMIHMTIFWSATPRLLSSMAISTGSAMKGCPVLSLSFGLHGAPGPSAALSAGEAFTPGSALVRMATAAQDVHW